MEAQFFSCGIVALAARYHETAMLGAGTTPDMKIAKLLAVRPGEVAANKRLQHVAHRFATRLFAALGVASLALR